MGTSKAFLNIPRQEAGYRPIEERITDFSQVEQTLNSHDRKLQASRCMDCGVPFCHWACPLGNKDPEFQAALSKGKWEMAYRILSQTNDFPEFTGRICPALCEKSCVLKLSFDAPVTIRENEAAIAEAAFREGYIRPLKPVRNGKKVAVIGAGPAGLSTAVRLNAQGFEVTIFDRNPMPGGLLRYGIPNFKLPKEIIDRRMKLLKEEGIHMEMGVTVDVEKLPEGFDAYALCTGTPEARDLNIPGRDLKGIYFALDMLAQQNRILDGETFPKEQLVNAQGKKVLVIGGGDTGSDCIGTSIRQGAVSVTQIENYAPAARRIQSGHSLAPMACRAENNFQSRRRLYPAVESEFEQIHWTERSCNRCRSRRSRMDSGCRRRTSHNETHREKRNYRSRYGTSGHGFPETQTSGASVQCCDSRRCRHRSLARREMPCCRTPCC